MKNLDRRVLRPTCPLQDKRSRPAKQTSFPLTWGLECAQLFPNKIHAILEVVSATIF